MDKKYDWNPIYICIQAGYATYDVDTIQEGHPGIEYGEKALGISLSKPNSQTVIAGIPVNSSKPNVLALQRDDGRVIELEGRLEPILDSLGKDTGLRNLVLQEFEAIYHIVEKKGVNLGITEVEASIY